MPALNFLPLPRVSHPKPPGQTDGLPTLPGPCPEYRPRDCGGFVVHGHTHSAVKFRDRQIHVGLDAWDLMPVPLNTLQKYVEDYTSVSSRKLPKRASRRAPAANRHTAVTES